MEEMKKEFGGKIKVLVANLEHTHSKLGIFIQDMLPDYMRLEWQHATGKAEGAKKKYLQLYEEIQSINSICKQEIEDAKEEGFNAGCDYMSNLYEGNVTLSPKEK